VFRCHIVVAFHNRCAIDFTIRFSFSFTCVSACISPMTSLILVFTLRCLSTLFFPSNFSLTMSTSKEDPHPPDTSVICICVGLCDAVSSAFRRDSSGCVDVRDDMRRLSIYLFFVCVCV